MTDVSYGKTYYHQADFLAGGTGYYANGGKIIPIFWTCDGDTEPFRFYHAEGEPLELGVGKTYVAVCSTDSTVTYETVAPVEETTTATEAIETTEG